MISAAAKIRRALKADTTAGGQRILNNTSPNNSGVSAVQLAAVKDCGSNVIVM